MDLITIKLGKYKSKGFGFKVQENTEGKLFVSKVCNDGIAYKNGLRCGDVIYSINNEVTKVAANDLDVKMSQLRGEVLLLVYRRDLQRSYNNLSTVSDNSNSGSSHKLSSSLSLTNLINYEPARPMFNAKHEPVEDIDDYAYPLSTCDSSDYSTDQPQAQITRKQGYKKSTNEPSNMGSPRIMVKKAAKSMSIYKKDPNITIKKRINTKMSDVAMAATNKTQQLRVNNHTNLASFSSNQLFSSAGNGDDTTYLTQMSSPEYQLHTSDVSNGVLDVCDGKSMELVHLEVNVKILSFMEKMKKNLWKKYMIENDALGVLFYCLDINDTQMACNSTAINPYISGLDFYMERWHTNNTISRFFLPIYQTPYNDEIDVVIILDNINIRYNKFELEFLVNFSSLSDEKISSLFFLFGLNPELLESKQQQVKTKRYHASLDNIRIDNRRQKTDKCMNESHQESFLSNLPQSKLVENVPLIVVVCIAIIERLGMKSEGIYRKSGNEGGRKKLENIVLNENPEKWTDYEEWTSVNTVCSLLKSILRSHSLIDKDTAIKLSMINLVNFDVCNQEQVYMDMMYHLRQHLCKIDTRTEQGLKDRTSFEIRCRLDTFKYLMKHLDRVSRYEMYNKMSADNLATCFCPTIIEDIPCNDNDEYPTSKKGDADRNLKQMLTFWITYADLVCEMLEEDEEQERYNKLVFFSLGKGRQKTSKEKPPLIDIEDESVSTTIKEQIEYYTSNVFIPISGYSSLGNRSPINIPEMSNLMKLKNLNLYQSFKQSKRDPRSRRSSTSLSPPTTRKMIQMDLVVEQSLKDISPFTRKKMDKLLTRSMRKIKKGPETVLLPQRKKIPFTSLRLSRSCENVPLIIDVCITLVECYGLDVDGIYRINGMKNELNSLEELVLDNNSLCWHEEPYLSMWSNLYNVSCLLKSILKKLFLIRKDTWVHISSEFAQKIEQTELSNVLMAAVYHLRQEKHSSKTEKDLESDIRCATLRHVLRHLKTVTRHSNNSRMSTNALAVCFMPVILEEDESDNFMVMNHKGIQIVEKLIDHCDWIFQWDDRPCEEVYSEAMRDSLGVYLRRYSSTEIGLMAPRTDDCIIYQQIVDVNKVRDLLVKFLSATTSNETPQIHPCLPSHRLTVRS